MGVSKGFNFSDFYFGTKGLSGYLTSIWWIRNLLSLSLDKYMYLVKISTDEYIPEVNPSTPLTPFPIFQSFKCPWSWVCRLKDSCLLTSSSYDEGNTLVRQPLGMTINYQIIKLQIWISNSLNLFRNFWWLDLKNNDEINKWINIQIIITSEGIIEI